jgi:hypothetical protein
MVRLSITASLLVLGFAIGPAVASSTTVGFGSLVGQTQISLGCPGPGRVGQPSCHPWHPFPHARFTIRQVGPAGRPLPQIVRLVVSDATGTFNVRLDAGTYLITPLAQLHTHGGKTLTIHIRSGELTRVLVRYQGYPQMV